MPKTPYRHPRTNAAAAYFDGRKLHWFGILVGEVETSDPDLIRIFGDDRPRKRPAKHRLLKAFGQRRYHVLPADGERLTIYEIGEPIDHAEVDQDGYPVYQGQIYDDLGGLIDALNGREIALPSIPRTRAATSRSAQDTQIPEVRLEPDDLGGYRALLVDGHWRADLEMMPNGELFLSAGLGKGRQFPDAERLLRWVRRMFDPGNQPGDQLR
ncbi:hypothetical protein [Rhodovibrio sodomensis]|uniref:hypothetical protein n=1 Tax=Rhodovibrio sodomensis TaxID=1088 RepID=UPI001903AD69|nr:hypothetical protein [Rhodovibrio sodomensis]